MRPALALALLAAAATLPARARTVYVPYAADDVVGTARYRTEIDVANRGGSPVRVEALFVSADGVRHPRLKTVVPARGSASLASAVPAGAHGHVEVTGPAEMAVDARLVAYGQDGHALSSEMEPVVSGDDLIPNGRWMVLPQLADAADAVTRMGIVTASDPGFCSLTAYLELPSGERELGSARATGAAAVRRLFAEPRQALGDASLFGARFAVICDTPAYVYAAVLANGGRRTAFVAAENDEGDGQDFTNEQIDALSRQAEPAAPKEEPSKAPSAAPPPAAAAALPARAGTLYVSYVADETVGAARYRTAIAVENHGSSPAQVKTRFVSSDGARHRGLTTTVPPGGSDSLARAVPEGTHGRLEVTAPPGTAVTARLVAYGRKGLPRSSEEELIIAESVMSPPGQTMYFRNLDLALDTVIRAGVVMADDSGSCSLTVHGDMASGMKELGSIRATGAAAVSRDFAEPLRALRIGSLAGAWLAVTCDTPALPYVAVLTADGRRASLLTPAVDHPLERQVTAYEPN